MSAVQHFNEPSLSEALAVHELVVLAFWAPWCGPCHAFAPVFAEVAEEYDDIVFGKIHVENEAALAAQFAVRSIPWVMAVREGVALYSQPGGLSAQAMHELIAHVQAVDMPQVRAALADGQK